MGSAQRMSARIADSAMYGHLWGTPEVRAVFEESARVQGWLDVLAALARAECAEGLIPGSAAEAITERADVALLDLDVVAAQTRATGHSTLGLIRALQDVLPPDVHPHVYVGASVQDLTDTWTSLAVRTVGGIVWRDLRRLESLLLDLAERHQDTVLAGRTHGQPGAPVTFGWKVASWADETRRHLDRMRDGGPRWRVGQLGGGVGTLAGLGPAGPAVRARFCAELGLADPGISWLAARDRVAEFGAVLAMVASSLARIGLEVYELQRPEIGELREPADPDVVGSITMPHKRNPERSEHLDTLARLVRSSAAVLLEGMVGASERDGRSWKAEWVALPEVCLLTCSSLQIAIELLEGLEVDAEAMRRNLPAVASSERALAELTPAMGKHAAQEALRTTLRDGSAAGRTPEESLATLIPDAETRQQVLQPDVGEAPTAVDRVVARARAARAAESETWP
jgi:adenylosuccinate lyase